MREKVIDIIACQLGVSADEIRSDTLLEDLYADEFDIVDIVMSIEDEFDFSLTDEEISSVKTAGDIIRAVEKKM